MGEVLKVDFNTKQLITPEREEFNKKLDANLGKLKLAIIPMNLSQADVDRQISSLRGYSQKELEEKIVEQDIDIESIRKAPYADLVYLKALGLVYLELLNNKS